MVGITATTNIFIRSINYNVNLAQTESRVFAPLAQQMRLDVVQIQQYLQDISATRAQDGLDKGFHEAGKHKDSFLACLSKFKELYVRENDKGRIDKVGKAEQAFHAYYEEGRKMAQAYIDGGPAMGNKFMRNFDESAETLNRNLDPFIEQQTTALHTSRTNIASSMHNLKLLTLIGSVISVVFGIFMAVFMPHKITTLLSKLITKLTDSTLQMAAASERILASSQSLSKTTSEQTASIEETSSTMEEISSMTVHNADNASEASEQAKACSNIVESGNNTIIEMDSAMQNITESSGKIADIIKIIDGIAFQTNLLALNAAVETTRAGEHGRGFAVVADEVRNLAQKSTAAARDITTLITDSVKKAETGMELVKKTKEVFSGVFTQAKKVYDLVNEIATASEEQTNGIVQISNAIHQMTQVVQQNALNTDETAASSEELSSQAQELKSIVDIIGAEVGIKSADMGREADACLKKEGARSKKMIADSSDNQNVYEGTDSYMHEVPDNLPYELSEKEPVMA